MKVILLEDVYKHGVAGEVVNVAPGFARNYLIPRRLAVKATQGELRRFENLRHQTEVRRAERNKEFEVIAEKIEGLTLYFPVRASESGKLYGSVTTGNIAEVLHGEIGLEIDRRRIGDRPLRELGDYQVPVRLEAHLTPRVKVVVYREGDDPREAEAEFAAEAEAQAAAFAEAEAAVEAEAAGEPVMEADTEATAGADADSAGEEA